MVFGWRGGWRAAHRLCVVFAPLGGAREGTQREGTNVRVVGLALLGALRRSLAIGHLKQRLLAANAALPVGCTDEALARLCWSLLVRAAALRRDFL